jgi:hypothetical protein
MISLLTCNSYGTNWLFLILLGRILPMLRCMLNAGINIVFTSFLWLYVMIFSLFVGNFCIALLFLLWTRLFVILSERGLDCILCALSTLSLLIQY